MPFKSEAQRRYMYAAKERGEIPTPTLKKWEKHTKNKDLPKKVAQVKEPKETKTIAVDLDGTLAKYDTWEGDDIIGDPIPKMVNRVKNWLSEGHVIHIFTARAFPKNGKKSNQKAIKAIKKWCKQHLGRELPVTYMKDPAYDEFWDDKAVGVVKNKGEA